MRGRQTLANIYISIPYKGPLTEYNVQREISLLVVESKADKPFASSQVICQFAPEMKI
jgi:hypothetical protein